MGNLYGLIIMSRASGVMMIDLISSARKRLPFLSRAKVQKKLKCLIKNHYSILVESYSIFYWKYILISLIIIIVNSNFCWLSFEEFPSSSYYWHYDNIHTAFWAKDLHFHRWKNKSTKSRVRANLHYFL